MKDGKVPAVTWTIPLIFSVLYALWPILRLPRFYYAPETREIFWHKVEGMLLMGWYGRAVLACVAGVILGLLLALLVKRLPARWQARGPWIGGVGVVAAMALTAVWEIYRWMV